MLNKLVKSLLTLVAIVTFCIYNELSFSALLGLVLVICCIGSFQGFGFGRIGSH